MGLAKKTFSRRRNIPVWNFKSGRDLGFDMEVKKYKINLNIGIIVNAHKLNQSSNKTKKNLSLNGRQ